MLLPRNLTMGGLLDGSKEDRFTSNSVCPPQRSHRGPIANAFFYLLLHVNRNTLLHLICYAKPE